MSKDLRQNLHRKPNYADISTTPDMQRALLLLNSCSADASSPSEPPLDSGPALLPVREAY